MIHVFGDSHSLSFAGIPNTEIHYLGPVTMHRIGRDGFDVAPYGADIVVWMFGEIDARCHIGRLRDEGRDQHKIIQTLVDNYIGAINKNNGVNIVCSVTPPSNFPKEVNDPSSIWARYGTIADRVTITRELNTALRRKAGLFLDVYRHYSTRKGILRRWLSDGIAHIGVEHNGYLAERLQQLIAQNMHNEGRLQWTSR